MDNTSILINQLTVMAIYLAVGFILQKADLITSKNSSALTSFLLYVILPCVIIKAFMQTSSPGKNKELLQALLMGGLVLVIAVGISFLFFKKDPVANFGASFSNAGFMAVPLITAIQGPEAVFYTAGMVAFLNILQWTYGQSILAGSWKECQPKAVIKNPLVISFMIGLLIYFTQLPLPSQVNTVIGAFSSCNGPVAMVIVGVYLGQMKLDAMKDPKVWLVCAVRLIIIPAATLAVFSLIKDIPDNMRTALLIAAIAPVGSNLSIYAAKQGKDVGSATAMVCLSTVLSLITMPVVMTLAASLLG